MPCAAVAGLWAALATQTSQEATARGRRTGNPTKQARVLAMLRRAEGASGPQLAEATGWAPHTVRGSLASLAKKGIKAHVLERVRQIGPNKAGTKGSYTVYHLAAEAQP